MHEVIGHASGQQAAGFKGTPQQAIKEHFSALEEGRADLVGALLHCRPEAGGDWRHPRRRPRQHRARRVRGLHAQRAGAAPPDPRRDHDCGRPHAQPADDRPVADGQHEGDRTADARRQDVSTMVDPKAFRDGVGTSAGRSSAHQVRGRLRAAAKLFDTYGVHFDPKLRDEVVARVDKLNLPSYTGFVQPKLEPVMGADGKITDVKISYPLDLTTQMLEYDGVKR